MNCERCGWQDKFEVKGEPVHAERRCPSTLKVGDSIYWNGGREAEDLPPLRATFVAVVEFFAPDDPRSAAIKLETGTILPQHYAAITGLEEGVDIYTVCYADLTPATKWPVLLESN